MYSIFGNDQTSKPAHARPPEEIDAASDDLSRHRMAPGWEPDFTRDGYRGRALTSFDVLILEEESFVPRAPAAPIPVSALAGLDRRESHEPALLRPHRQRAAEPTRRERPSMRVDAAGRATGDRMGRFAPVLAIVGVIAVSSLAIAGRVPIANALPATAPLYAAIGIPANARGLDIRDVRSTWMEDQGQSYLVVEGQIANLRNAPSKLGALRLSLRDPSGREIYTWSAPPPEPRVGAAGVVKFKTRLASPPRDAQDVLVRFGERG